MHRKKLSDIDTKIKQFNILITNRNINKSTKIITVREEKKKTLRKTRAELN